MGYGRRPQSLRVVYVPTPTRQCKPRMGYGRRRQSLRVAYVPTWTRQCNQHICVVDRGAYCYRSPSATCHIMTAIIVSMLLLNKHKVILLTNYFR